MFSRQEVAVVARNGVLFLFCRLSLGSWSVMCKNSELLWASNGKREKPLSTAWDSAGTVLPIIWGWLRLSQDERCLPVSPSKSGRGPSPRLTRYREPFSIGWQCTSQGIETTARPSHVTQASGAGGSVSLPLPEQRWVVPDVSWG